VDVAFKKKGIDEEKEKETGASIQGKILPLKKETYRKKLRPSRGKGKG